MAKVITPSAKADGFSRHAGADCLYVPRALDPSALENYLSTDDIASSRHDPQAEHSLVPTIREDLRHGAPHKQVWLVPRGSIFTSSRPTLSALYESLTKKEFQPASCTDFASASWALGWRRKRGQVKVPLNIRSTGGLMLQERPHDDADSGSEAD